MKSCILLVLFLAGCSSNTQLQTTNIRLGKITTENSNKVGYKQKIDSIQYLFRYEAEDMLNNISKLNLSCKSNFILDVELGYKDLYGHVKQSNSLNKKSNYYTLSYKLYNILDSKQQFSGEITTIDSFVVPSSSYAYVISTEDSQIAGVNNLTKQLESEIIYLLYNTCK